MLLSGFIPKLKQIFKSHPSLKKTNKADGTVTAAEER